MLGTIVNFTVSGVPEEQALVAIRAAAEEMTRIEALFTIYGELDNSVKQFNQSKPGVPVSLPQEVDALLLQSKRIRQQTHGAFDAGLGSLNLLWGFSQEPAPVAPPQAAQINMLLGHGAKEIRRISDKWVRDSAQARLDFGGIAKGYAIDRAMEVLKQHGIAHAIVDAGGDMRVIGNHGGKPWKIGIRHPRKTGAIGYLPVQGDQSIVTSGDYERFFEFEGKRYHHILDPQTGYPASRCMSVTVLAGDATTADAWSTALFVLGPGEGLKLVEATPGVEALWVTNVGSVVLSSGMRSMYKISPQ